MLEKIKRFFEHLKIKETSTIKRYMKMICKRAQKYKNNIKHNELGKALHKRINSASYILEGGGGGSKCMYR